MRAKWGPPPTQIRRYTCNPCLQALNNNRARRYKRDLSTARAKTNGLVCEGALGENKQVERARGLQGVSVVEHFVFLFKTHVHALLFEGPIKPLEARSFVKTALDED